MTRLVLSICGERTEGGWNIRRYANFDEANGTEHVGEARRVRASLDRLGGKDSSWTVDVPPPPGVDRFFDIFLTVSGRRDDLDYDADYHKYPGCPAAVIADGMGIYSIIRKEGVRKAKVARKAAKAAKRARKEELRKKSAASVAAKQKEESCTKQ